MVEKQATFKYQMNIYNRISTFIVCALCSCALSLPLLLLDLGLVVAHQVVPVLHDLGQLVVLSTVIELDRENVKNDNREAINNQT